MVKALQLPWSAPAAPLTVAIVDEKNIGAGTPGLADFLDRTSLQGLLYHGVHQRVS